MEFEASTRTQETTFSFGYQMELPEAKMVFRGNLMRSIAVHRGNSTFIEPNNCLFDVFRNVGQSLYHRWGS